MMPTCPFSVDICSDCSVEMVSVGPLYFKLTLSPLELVQKFIEKYFETT